jgi:hypothetical protein
MVEVLFTIADLKTHKSQCYCCAHAIFFAASQPILPSFWWGSKAASPVALKEAWLARCQPCAIYALYVIHRMKDYSLLP